MSTPCLSHPESRSCLPDLSKEGAFVFMEIAQSDIVVATAGRDKGKPFLVLSIDHEYVFLADGRLRRAEKPKRKKIKHVRFEASGSGRAAEKLQSGEKVINSEVRRALADYSASSDGQ